VAKFHRTERKLKQNHTWRCTPGYQMIVMGRGDLSFEYPSGWLHEPGETSIKCRDKPYPKDNFVLEVSCLRLGPIEQTPYTLPMLLAGGIGRGKVQEISEDEIRTFAREDMQIVWYERREIDREQHKPVIWRHAMCHTGSLYGILSFGFWEEYETRGDALWNHFLKTVIMDRTIEDPTAGPRFH
jgi:hypothetical protein